MCGFSSIVTVWMGAGWTGPIDGRVAEQLDRSRVPEQLERSMVIENDPAVQLLLDAGAPVCTCTARHTRGTAAWEYSHKRSLVINARALARDLQRQVLKCRRKRVCLIIS